jgi:hypothetical protein
VNSQIVFPFESISLAVPPKPPKSILGFGALNRPIILPLSKISKSLPDVVSKFHSHNL